MPNLRKRKSHQIPFSGKKTDHGANNRRMSPRKSLGNQGVVREEKNPSDFSNVIATRSLHRQNKKTKSNIEPKTDTPEPAVTEISTNINELADEVLIKIFSYLNTKTIVKFVGRTCKRWNRLSKDKVLWRIVDIGFARLNPVAAKKIFRLFCEPGRLESLYIRAESHRFEDDKPDSSNRDWYWETKCERSVRLNNCEVKADIESLTPGTLKKLKEVGTGLVQFGIECEQICANIDLLSALPSNQLTHLSLAYCNLSIGQFSQLLLPDTDSLLKELLVFDLTGVEVFDLRRYGLPDYGQLPPKVHTLILRDSEFSLYNRRFQYLILGHSEKLIELDLSIMCIDYEFLWTIARSFENLEYLNLCGSVLAWPGRDTINNKKKNPDDEWMLSEWRFRATVFLWLKTANLRNLTQVGGGLMENPEWYQLGVSHINTNGEKVYRNYDDDGSMPPPELLSEIERKWEDWTPCVKETTKYTYEARQVLDRERRTREHPDWPVNLWPSHPDYKKYG